MNNQAYLFVIFVINGILIGFLFDVFRIIRRTFKTTDLATYIQDIAFWIIAGIITLAFIFYYNNGEIRFYVLLGIILGVLSYILTISKYVIQVSVKIINYIKKIISTIINFILLPLKAIWKIINRFLFKPFFFVFINIRKNLTKNTSSLTNFIKKIHKPTKNNI